MNRQALLKLAASTLVVALGASGCSGLDLTRLSPGSDAGSLARSASDWSAKSAALAARGRHDQALVAAENAVAASPADAALRAGLGHRYLAAGRFGSAATAFADAMELGQADSRTAVSRVLALVAIGQGSEAIDLLIAHADNIPAADYGLALALAGDPETAILVLTNAARQADATPRTRQNLAFAYALAGRWLEAKILAAQDINRADLDKRMTDWARMFQADSPQLRVAGLLGVTPQADAGLPVRLALVDAPDAQVALAAEAVAEIAADPIVLADLDVTPATALAPVAVAVPVDVAAQPVDVAALDAVPTLFEASVPPAPVAIAAVAAEPAPAPVAVVIPVEIPAPILAAPVVERVSAAAPAPVVRAEPVAPAFTPASAPRPLVTTPAMGRSGWVVQLGAFQNNAIAREAWGKLSRRHAALGNADASSHQAVVRGKTYYRLAASGFANQSAASSACASVKASGGICFVRRIDGVGTMRWSSRGNGTKLASR